MGWAITRSLEATSMKSSLFPLSARSRAPENTAGAKVSRLWRTPLLCAAWACCFLLPSVVSAQVTYTPITHSAFQAVLDEEDAGKPAWPGKDVEPYPIELTGVVVNNPGNMLNYNNAASFPQWQVYIQAQAGAPGDFGGTALYMLKYSWIPGQQYTDTEWANEMNRVNYPLNLSGQQVSTPLQYGDVVKVDAKAPGLFYNGKYNVNEKHMKSPDYDFSITVLARDTVPSAASITLEDLKNSDNTFIFDDKRATGCEHYQGSLVHLDSLLLTDPLDWELGKTVTVRQGSLTFPMIVGLDSAFSSVDPFVLQTSPFSVTAIMDQESADLTSGYRFWLTEGANLTVSSVPEPSGLAMLAAGGLAGFWIWCRHRHAA
jgi:hypothetical protein